MLLYNVVWYGAVSTPKLPSDILDKAGRDLEAGEMLILRWRKRTSIACKFVIKYVILPNHWPSSTIDTLRMKKRIICWLQ